MQLMGQFVSEPLVACLPSSLTHLVQCRAEKAILRTIGVEDFMLHLEIVSTPRWLPQLPPVSISMGMQDVKTMPIAVFCSRSS